MMQSQRQTSSDPRAKLYGEHIDRDPRLILERFGQLGNDVAHTKAAYEAMEDMSKPLIARLKGEIEQDYIKENNKPPTETYLERLAFASPEYKSHVEHKAKTRKEYLVTNAKYIVEQAYIELLRSLESSSRAQLQRT